MTEKLGPAFVALGLAFAVAATPAFGDVSGTVRCDAPGTAVVTATLMRWNTATGEATVVFKTPARPDGSFRLKEPAPQRASTSSRFAVIFEGPGCRPVVRALGPEQKAVGSVVMPTVAGDVATTSVAVRGHVHLPNGGAAAATVVRLMAIQFDQFSVAPFAFTLQPGGEHTTSMVTDGAGVFAFYLSGVPPNPYEEGVGLHLLVKHPDYPPLMLPIEAKSAESIVVTLSVRSVRLRGIVVDSMNAPVDAADVFAASLHDDWTTLVTGRTSATGQFDLELPASDQGIRLAVDHQSFVPMELAPGLPEWSAGPVQIQLQRGTNLKGRLIQQTSGEPVPSGHMRAQASDGMFAIMRSATTDTGGYYEISGIAHNRMPPYVVAEAEGFVTRELAWETVAEASEPTTLKPIALVRSVSWTLEVMDPRGQRVQNALVVIMQSLSGPEVKAVRTDANGRVVAKVAPGRYVVRVSASGFPELFETIEITTSRNDRIRLFESAAIRARILWSDSTPAIGLKVKCLPARPDPETPGSFDILPDQREAVTDDIGTFVIERLAPGPYLLQLEAAEFISRSIEPGAWPELVVLPPGALVDVEAILPKSSSVELVLLGATMPAMPKTLEATLSELNRQGEIVNDFSPVRLTVADGRALLEGIPPGRYNVEFRLDVEGIIDPRVLEVSNTFTSVAVEIVSGQGVDGIVISEEGTPLVGAAVSIWLDRGSSLSFGTSADDLTLEELQTDQHGRFATKVMRIGRYLALATMDSFAPAVVLFQIEEAREPSLQTLILPRGFPLQIDILTPLGRPPRDMIATLIRMEPLPGGRSFQGVQQDCEPVSSGCLFENVSPGPYILRIVRRAETKELPLTVTSQAVLRVTVGRMD